MRFSERHGYKPIKDQLQIESLDLELKNSLWSILYTYVKNLNNSGNEGYELHSYCLSLWLNFFKLPIDTSPIYSDRSVDRNELHKHIRSYFFETPNWYDPYDLIQFTAHFTDNNFISSINKILEREKSAY